MINLLYTIFYRVSEKSKEKTHGNLSIKLTNVSGSNGVMNVSLHRDDWESTLRQEVFPFTCIIDDTMVIEDLPFGDYAIRVFHDVNCNGIIDKNNFGYTKESLGYSGEFPEGHSIPSPKTSLIRFDTDHRQIIIRMRTPKV